MIYFLGEFSFFDRWLVIDFVSGGKYAPGRSPALALLISCNLSTNKLIYYKQIQVIHRWIQNSAQQLRSGLTVNRLLNMSTYGF